MKNFSSYPPMKIARDRVFRKVVI